MADTQFLPAAGQTPSFKGHTLLIPAVSCANVGQLCADLLIFNSMPQIKKIGHFRSRCILPVAGNDALRTSEDPPGVLSTAIEVFQFPDKHLTILQQRAPIVNGRRQILAEDLIKWSVSVGVKQVIVLAGADSSFWTEEQLVHRKIRYLQGRTEKFVNDQSELSRNEKEILKMLAANGVEELKKKPVVDLALGELVPDGSGKEEFPVARGGLLKPLVAAAEKAGLACLGLVLFCKEGDNIPEGMAMAELVNKLCGVVDGEGEGKAVNWRSPSVVEGYHVVYTEDYFHARIPIEMQDTTSIWLMLFVCSKR